MPRLKISLPDGSEATHDLGEDVITVGRVSDNAIRIDDASVSSHHAELFLRDEDYSLKDLHSTNGTQLNGQPVTPDEELQLQHGDTIVFGNISVAYLSEEGADQQPLPQESEPTLAPASSSVTPADFANASPFQNKKKKKDPANMAVIAVSVLALLAAGGAIAIIYTMQPPTLPM